MKLTKRKPAVDTPTASSPAKDEDDSLTPGNGKAIIRLAKTSVASVPGHIKTYFSSRSLSFGLLKISKVKYLTKENIVVPNGPLTCLALLGTTMVAGPTFLNVETLEVNHGNELARKVQETQEDGDDFPMRDRVKHSRKRKKEQQEISRVEIEEGMKKMEMEGGNRAKEDQDGGKAETEEDFNGVEDCDVEDGCTIRNRIGYLSGLDAEEHNMVFGDACVRV